VEHFANLVTIQKLMGHGDIRTTMIYLQLTHKNNLNQVISPLDCLQQ
jgi:site-specific recombinase XerD